MRMSGVENDFLDRRVKHTMLEFIPPINQPCSPPLQLRVYPGSACTFERSNSAYAQTQSSISAAKKFIHVERLSKI